MIELEWNPPRYKPARKLPFIPLEEEIDALISGCGKKIATCLQLLKETGVRIGEAWQLRWIDVDSKKRTVTCRSEKGSKPRKFRVSQKLIGMLNALPKRNDLVFGGTNLNGHRSNFASAQKIGEEAPEPQAREDSLPHSTALESNYGIPQNKRRNTCQGTLGT
jgi:integrase